jgi:hypothetical protein
MSAPFRGSRKHILDWRQAPSFGIELNCLLAHTGVVVPPTGRVLPTGAGLYGAREARLESFLPPRLGNELRKWWLASPRGANTPNWDLAAEGSLNGNPALVLIEAKANTKELAASGKPRPRSRIDTKSSALVDPSDASWRNHARIGAALSEADASLNDIAPGFRVDRDSHYQFSNRIAFTWKLASLGLPTVLIYLGFTGDSGITDAGPMLADEGHWRTLMNRHVTGRLPSTALDRWIPAGDAQFYVTITARACLNSSPPRRRKPLTTHEMGTS